MFSVFSQFLFLKRVSACVYKQALTLFKMFKMFVWVIYCYACVLSVCIVGYLGNTVCMSVCGSIRVANVGDIT